MIPPRRLEPEWLDQWSADDPRAIRVRRDLKLVNMFMRNASCMGSALKHYSRGRRPRTIVDLGCGDGQFMLRVAGRLARHWPGVRVILQDQQNIVSEKTQAGFATLDWSVDIARADVFDFLAAAGPSQFDILTSNLFLHHFSEPQLSCLLAAAARSAWLVVACEPRRAKFVVRASRLLWAVGCSDMTVHDAVVSARAGFIDNELGALWPDEPDWELLERPAGIFTHCFVARRSQLAAAP